MGAPIVVTAVLLVWPARVSAHPQSTLDPESSGAESITGLWWFMLVAAGIVVAVVTTLLLLAVLRRQGSAADRLAGRVGGPRLVDLGGAVIPAVVLAVLFALTLDVLLESAPGHLEPELTVDVTGNQWFWDVTYPESPGVRTANEIHVPVGVPIRIRVHTGDVLHSFWVPQINRKVDLVPGRVNEVTFEVRSPGTFRGQCAEYCGIQHANMALLIVAEPQEAFQAWLIRTAHDAREPVDAAARRGQEVFMSSGCAACHRIAGTEAQGRVGPDLTHLASRRTIAAVTLPNTRSGLQEWVAGPQHVKPGNRMPDLDVPRSQLEPLLDYLGSLR